MKKLIVLTLGIVISSGLYFVNNEEQDIINVSSIVNYEKNSDLSNITIDNNILKQDKDRLNITFKNVINKNGEVSSVKTVVYPIDLGKGKGETYKCEKKDNDFHISISLNDFKNYTGDYVAEVYINEYNKPIDKLFFKIKEGVDAKEFYIKCDNEKYFNIYLEDVSFYLGSEIKKVKFFVWSNDIYEVKEYSGINIDDNTWKSTAMTKDFNMEDNVINVYCEVIDEKGKTYKLGKTVSEKIIK